jgi:hypothetical protein
MQQNTKNNEMWILIAHSFYLGDIGGGISTNGVASLTTLIPPNSVENHPCFTPSLRMKPLKITMLSKKEKEAEVYP